MLKVLLAGGVIFGVLLVWIAVQHLARAFARRHPEWGPYRESGGCGAGGACSCGDGGRCRKQ
jgi:hypothetical protein